MATKHVDIISEIRQKNGTGYDSFYVGPEVKHVGASRKSGNNNLEEQLILGTDKIETSWEEDNVKREHVAYTDDESSNSYYILDSYLFKHGSSDSEVYFDNQTHTLYFRDANRLGVDSTDPNLLLFYNNNDNFFMLTKEGNKATIHVYPAIVSKEEILKFKQSNGEIQDISKKQTSVKEYRDDDGLLIRRVTKEKIYSLLN